LRVEIHEAGEIGFIWAGLLFFVYCIFISFLLSILIAAPVPSYKLIIFSKLAHISRPKNDMKYTFFVFND